MKVAVDAMGGDYPLNNIEGAIKSLDDPELEIFLVGEPEKLADNLKGFSYDTNITFWVFWLTNQTSKIHYSLIISPGVFNTFSQLFR